MKLFDRIFKKKKPVLNHEQILQICAGIANFLGAIVDPENDQVRTVDTEQAENVITCRLYCTGKDMKIKATIRFIANE